MNQEIKPPKESLLRMAKRKRFWSDFFLSKKGIVSIVFFLGASYLGYTYYFAQTATTTSATVEEETTAQKRNLRVSIGTSGTVQNSADTQLSFGTNGTVKEVFVKQGQKVKVGDKIAQLETDSLDFEVRKAELSLQSAETNLLTKKSPSTASDILISQKSIESAGFSLQNTIQQNELDIKDGEISVETAKRNYDSVVKEVSGNTMVSETDIKTSELNITNAKNDLEIAKSNAENTKNTLANNLQQAYENAVLKIDSSTGDMLSSLQEADRVLEENMKSGYGIGYLLGAKDPTTVPEARSHYILSRSLYETFLKDTKKLTKTSSPEEITASLEKGISVLKEIDTSFDFLVRALDNTITDATVTPSTLSSIKNGSSSAQSRMKSAITSLVSVQQNIETTLLSQQTQLLSADNAVKSAENKLISAENSASSLTVTKDTSSTKDGDKIITAKNDYESAQRQLENTKFKAESSLQNAKNQLEIAKAQFELKLNPLTKGDILSLNNQIESARISLDTVKYNLAKSTILSPVEGEVLQLNTSAGETVKIDATDPVAIIASKNTYEIEVYIEEGDIAQVQVGQKAYATVDALEDTELEGVVSFVSNTATKDSNSIITYLVRIPISTENANLREGMTAQVELILAEASNALSVPVQAVKNVNGAPSVKNSKGEWIPVSTGFTDGKYVEILSGLTEGDKILSTK